MNNPTGIIGLTLLILNFAISYKGFTDKAIFDKYKFEVDRILIGKEYNRLFSSGFLHLNWMHLIFNMYSLYSFSELLELELGSVYFLIIYLVSLIGGSLLALFIHRNHGDYSAVGASGAVCGVIFASIALYPQLQVGIPLTDISFKSWMFGLLFLAFTLFGIKTKKGNIGHEAHLGGAILGMIAALIIRPSSLSENLGIILMILIPSLAFISLIIYKPEFLLVNNFSRGIDNEYDLDHAYNKKVVDNQNEVDRILEKIKSKGLSSLSKKEKEFLDNN